MLKRRMPRAKIGHLTCVGAFAVAMLTVGLALGAGLMSTDAQAGGEITACVNNFTGQLRIANGSGQCAPTERPLTWNQQGPEGRQGPSGLLDVQHISETITVTTEDNQSIVGSFVSCPVGYTVIGGGATMGFVSGSDNFFLRASLPLTGLGPDADLDGWSSGFETSDGELAVGQYSFITTAICALIDEPQADGS